MAGVAQASIPDHDIRCIEVVYQSTHRFEEPVLRQPPVCRSIDDRLLCLRHFVLGIEQIEQRALADIELLGIGVTRRELDVDLVRVLEDVVDLLVARGIFRFTDLPDSAQQKLLFRKNLRSKWQPVPNPLGSDEGLI